MGSRAHTRRTSTHLRGRAPHGRLGPRITRAPWRGRGRRTRDLDEVAALPRASADLWKPGSSDPSNPHPQWSLHGVRMGGSRKRSHPAVTHKRYVLPNRRGPQGLTSCERPLRHGGELTLGVRHGLMPNPVCKPSWGRSSAPDNRNGVVGRTVDGDDGVVHPAGDRAPTATRATPEPAPWRRHPFERREETTEGVSNYCRDPHL